MSRAQGRPRGPPPAGGLKGFGQIPTTRPGGPSLGAKGGFGGYATVCSKSGLAYVAERADLSAISDAHVAVSFKNLGKKDSTTKARALEELVAHAQAHPYSEGGGVENAILEAWVPCYPRLSIDDARRVRELAHTLQLALLQSARKRMERQLPQVAGPWLAGTYDRDRAVAKVASDGLASFLSTEDKATLFWKRLQPQILNYATAALQESPTTLSDMRSSTQDEADYKYYRVLYSSISLVLALLQRLAVADTETLSPAYAQFFAAEAIWEGALLSPDSHVRRVTYELFLQCLETRPDFLLDAQLPRLKKRLILEAPKKSQAGSVVEYLQVLRKLTIARPDIWSQESSHAYTQLRPLLERGSQGTSASTASPSQNVWTQFDNLLAAIPVQEIFFDEASDVLASFRKGLSSRSEPQSNAIDGWTAYLSMVRRLIDAVSPDDCKVALVVANVYPLFHRFFSPPAASPPSTGAWATGAHVSILSRASLLVARPAYTEIVTSARLQWTKLASAFTERMANSLPEVSKAFKTSQDEIAREGDRWFSLVADIHRSVQQAEAHQQAADGPGSANLVEDVLEQPSLSVLQSAADLLQKRNFKPFGAAQVASAAFTHASYLLHSSKSGREVISALFPIDNIEQLSLMLASPSASSLLSCLRAMAHDPAFADQYAPIYASIIPILLANKDDDAEKTAQFIKLLISDASDAALATSRRNNNLQIYLGEACLATAQGKATDWDLFNATFASDALSTTAAKTLATKLIDSLGEKEVDSTSVLTALETVAVKAPALLIDDEELHLALVTKLLGMLKIQDTALLAKVHTLRALVDGGGIQNKRTKSEQPSRLLRIVHENLDAVGPNVLDVDTLVEQAVSIARSPSATAEDKENLFPDTNSWMQAMQSFFEGSILNPSLALVSNVGSAYLLVQQAKKTTQTPAIHRDRNGNSIPARMASYLTQLLSSMAGDDDMALSALPQEFQVELLYLLYLTAELGADQIALNEADSLWGNLADSQVLFAAEECISAIQSTLANTFKSRRNLESSALVDALIFAMLQQSQRYTALAVYTTRALSGLLQMRMENRTFSSTTDEDYLVKQNLWKTGPATTLGAMAFLSGYGELLSASKSVSNFCNRLVSDVAAADPWTATKKQAALETLVLLNACMSVYGPEQLPTASNRLVFAVKQITSWFVEEADTNEEKDEDSGQLDLRITAESCRALQRLLPSIKGIYGPHWERSIKFCIGLWNRAAAVVTATPLHLDQYLPCIHASLKLINTLESIEDSNDDLEDAIALFSEPKWTSMRQLLVAFAHQSTAPTVFHPSRTQPQAVVDALLCRMVSKTPLRLLTAETGSLYTLVASDSRDIQAAGFGLLHRALPALQEQLSFDTILEKKEARLPGKLLSLLIDAPTLEAYADDVLSTYPTPIRGYLLAWRLVFDAFSTASAKVRVDYAAHLATGNYVAALLDFTFDVLGHSAAHPINLDKEGLANRASIASFDIGEVEASAASDEKQMHRLLVHLYYLILKNVPGQFRAWYIACRTKQTTVAVEAWTAKYVSALVVEDVLDDVALWAQTQEDDGAPAGGSSDDANREMIVKTNKRAREVVAGYEVDELMLSIALRLPSNYPIDNVSVVGVNRVAVNEKKWQSWLMITQGVIAFSNGSLVEGLATFRRNVLGALRGQTECAICYSIISEEKRVPEKRCGTCKNMFHRSCLYKWFLTSNQNSCPLCRNPISFLGSEKFKRRADPE